MDKITYNNKTYSPYEYDNEAEFERDVVKFASSIFGENTIYFDVKKKISNQNIVTIPDGYLIDLSFPSDPCLYIIENELVTHDPYRHIGQQLLKFAVSYKTAGHDIKSFLREAIEKDGAMEKKLDLFIKDTSHRSIDAFLDALIFAKNPNIIVVIDEKSDDLNNVLSQLTAKADVLFFKKFVGSRNANDVMYQFTPFQQELANNTKSMRMAPTSRRKFSYALLETMDTIVVPANEEGFQRVFLKQNCWHEIRISSRMLDKIRYIAAYQTAPISAITYVAEVARIDRWKDTDKYIVYFKSKAKKIKPIKLTPKHKVKPPKVPVTRPIRY